ncbi:MAG: RlmE family RNA methyltransferase [Spirochaetia bacterium]|jgi:23S rRNA (uridine2552-2'-O)-methyltransferase|nr:RlmE family RNA methyltransferase [Spirochaetia bacterium]
MREISDHWARKAKQEGYPARSVYKLKEIEEKFGVLPQRGLVLDLGASPGSWTLFVLRHREGRCAVVAADLAPLDLRPAPEGLVFHQGDICESSLRLMLETEGPYDTLLSDAAPSTTGNRTVDTARSEALVGEVLEIARGALKPGGACVVKIFQGSGQKRIMDGMKKIFATVKAFKPKACRSESFETYFIGQNKIGGKR